jgi:Fe-S cluster assembly protein SufD
VNVDAMPTTEKTYDWFLKSFDSLEKSLNGESKAPVHAIRKNAMARFVELGFPTVRNEEWRFTNIAPIRSAQFHPTLRFADNGITKAQLEPLFVTDAKGIKLVFINGHFAENLSSVPSSIKNVNIGSLASALKHGDPFVNQFLARYASVDNDAFVALNTAFMQDGAYVRIEDGISLEEPIECLFITSSSNQPSISNPRNLFLVGKKGRATIVESYVALDGTVCLDNVVSEIVVGEDAVVEHDKLEMEGEGSYHIGTIQIHQSARSNYTNNVISLGGKIVRNTITVVLADQNAEATLNGLSLGTGDQLIDSHTTIDHTMPNCTSHELYKAVLDGRAKGVFNGKIFVRQDAQKTDAKQTNKTLLLSDDATINTKPQLEIFADDVKCTHGAAVGQLDEEQVFYLRSRGIGERSARDILTFAFASDVVERVHTESLREKLRDLIQRRLEQGRINRG